MRAVFALLVASAAAAQTDPVTAARQREQALSSVEFVLTVKGPKEAGTVRLVYDGPKARYERHITSGQRRRLLGATDGERVRTQLVWEDATRAESAGNIVHASEGVTRDARLLPLLFTARGLTPVHCPFPADTLTPAGTADIRGRECEQFASGTATLWLDPSAGFTLRRYKQGGMVIDVESSDANPAKVWLPTSYTVDGHEYTVERVEMGKQYPDAEFDPPWPPGVQVSDTIGGRRYVTDADGTLQVADTQQVVWDWFVRLWWVPVAAVAVGGGLLGWRLWKVNRGCQPAGGSPPRPPHP